jgi:hypothetical protein
MHDFSATGLSCLERERLSGELDEAQTRGRNLTRLRKLTVPEEGLLGTAGESGAGPAAEIMWRSTAANRELRPLWTFL